PRRSQVSTSGLSPPDSSAPLRQLLRRQRNVDVRMATVSRIDADAREVEFEHADGSRQMGYDYLLLASGATHAYFGNEHWSAHAPGLKTLDDALDLDRKSTRLNSSHV